MANVRKLKPKPQLTETEIKRLAERIAVIVEHDSDSIGLLCMLLDHLENFCKTPADIFHVTYTVRKHLFLGTSEADDAQDQFQASVYANRGKFLLWPNERSAS